MSAPAGCSPDATVEAEVERLTNRKLSEVEGVDFDVQITRLLPERWELVLRILPREAGAEPRTRRLAGASCAELADALAVAIAMSLEDQPVQSDLSSPLQLDSTGKLRDAHASPVAAVTRDREAPPRARPVVNSGAAPTLWTMAAGADGLLEAGALPKAALGVGLELSLIHGILRLATFGAFFPAQTSYRDASAIGGKFRLALGGLEACARLEFGVLAPLGCAGFELGQLSAEGRGINQPQLRNSLWSAVRLEAGVAVRMTGAMQLVARGGLSVPFVRPEFVADGNHVHQPSVLIGEGVLGIEFFLF